MNSILDQISTVEEMAKKWGVTDRTIRNWCESGLLEAKKLVREWAILNTQPQPIINTIPEIKITGLKKAVGLFNNWQGAAKVYLDLDELKVWTDTILKEDQHESHIRLVISKNDTDTTSMKDLQAECEALINNPKINQTIRGDI